MVDKPRGGAFPVKRRPPRAVTSSKWEGWPPHASVWIMIDVELTSPSRCKTLPNHSLRKLALGNALTITTKDTIDHPSPASNYITNSASSPSLSAMIGTGIWMGMNTPRRYQWGSQDSPGLEDRGKEPGSTRPPRLLSFYLSSFCIIPSLP